MNRKIALVSNTGWSLYNFRRNLMIALQGKGYDVIAVSPADEYTGKLPVRHIPVVVSRKGINPLGELRLKEALQEIYRQENVDYVLHFTTKPNIWGTLAAASLSKKKKIGVINNIAGLGIVFAKKGPVRFILENLYRFSQGKADRIFFQNPDDWDMFKAARLVPAEKTALLPGSGVDIELFPYTALPGAKDRLVFIMSARLLKEKGVCQYVAAARSIRKDYPLITFQLLGKPDPGNRTSVTQDEIDHWVKDGTVEWIPWSDNVPELLGKADCVVLPSYYREGTPRSLLEGMAMGRPLITADSPGCRETVVEGVNGYLVEPKSIESLEKALRSFISLESEEREKMSRESRKLAEERFDEKIVISRYLNTLDLLEEDVVK